MCKYLLSFFIALICCLHPHCSESQSTTVRPYKFGFSIDEQQHRYEKRDERGIVMGEFGFITADGIYHVTVYATDEQGRFRILAMKNYPYKANPKTIEIVMTPKVAPTTTTTTTTTARPTLPRQNFYNEACSGCFLSNGNDKPKIAPEAQSKTSIRPLSKPLPPAGVEQPNSDFPKSPSTQTKPGAASLANNQPTAGTTTPGPKTTKTPHVSANKVNNRYKASKKPVIKQNPTITQPESKHEISHTKPETLQHVTQPRIASKSKFQHHTVPQVSTTPHTTTTPPRYIPTSIPKRTTKLPQNTTSHPHKTSVPETVKSKAKTQAHVHQHNRNSKDSSNVANAQPKSPTLQPNVMDVIVNRVLPSVMGSKGVVAKPTTGAMASGGSPANSLIPAGKSGSANPTYGNADSKPVYKSSDAGAGSARAIGGGAASAAAVGADGDLYRFKYILDYHGHTETGKRNGNKEGNYYAIGDDDIERTIQYVANENGYQPRIQWRKLNSPVPSKENTLKDYEFVWFTLN